MGATNKQYYVYSLAWPNGRPFYIGKGSGDRSEQHFLEARRGECICLRCQIIQRIWKQGREVKVTHLLETDNQKEALRLEFELILDLSTKYQLANKIGNQAPGGVVYPERPFAYLTHQEFSAHFRYQIIDPAKMKEIHDDWLRSRIDFLEAWCRQAVRFHRSEEVSAELDELATLRAKQGQARQLYMALVPPKNV